MLNMKYEVTEKKAAQLLGVSPARVSQLVKEKLLDTVTFMGMFVIFVESINGYH